MWWELSNFAREMRKRLKIPTIMLLLTVVAVAANTKFTLVIDAGHGGGDAEP